MKNFATRTLLSLALCAAMAAAALADGKTTTKMVTFTEDITVEGTLFKKGTYKMEYNDETGELTVFNGKKSVTAKAHVADLEKAASQTRLSSVLDGKTKNLKSITFRGESRAYVLGESTQQANKRAASKDAN